MASWYYAHNGEQRGPVDENEFRMLQQTGVVKASTLVWQEGMADWLTLAEVQGRPRPSSTANAMQAPGQAPSALGQTAAPSGTFTTPSPGGPAGPGPAAPSPYAPSPYNPSPYAGTITVEQDGPPWEDAYKPLLSRVWETLKGSIFQPMEFFGRMRKEGDYVAPMYYLALTSFVGTLVSVVWQVPLQAMSLIGQNQGGGGNQGVEVGAFVLGMFCVVILSPILAVAGSFISAAINHLMLMLFGGANHSFETTYRVICYVTGATVMINAIPCVGGCIAIWGIVMQIIGLHKAHDTDLWRAACAVLVPAAVCCVGVVLIFIAFFGAIMAAVGQQGGAGGF